MVNPNLIKLAQEYGSDVCPDIKKLLKPKKLEGVVEGLGKNYGLVFRDHSLDKIAVTLDGKTTTTIADQGYYLELFFDSKDLYYTQRNCLYKWPNQLVRDFETSAWGITKYKCDILVALLRKNKIAKSSTGEILGANPQRPINIGVFKGELYHTEGFDSQKGLVKTLENRAIAKTGDWANGMTVLGDKLYFSGADRRIYSYDGRKVEEVCDTDFPIWALHGVQGGKGLIYAAGGYKKGILVVPLDNPENKKTILKDDVYESGSIVSAPIGFVKELMKNGKS